MITVSEKEKQYTIEELLELFGSAVQCNQKKEEIIVPFSEAYCKPSSNDCCPTQCNPCTDNEIVIEYDPCNAKCEYQYNPECETYQMSSTQMRNLNFEASKNCGFTECCHPNCSDCFGEINLDYLTEQHYEYSDNYHIPHNHQHESQQDSNVPQCNVPITEIVTTQHANLNPLATITCVKQSELINNMAAVDWVARISKTSGQTAISEGIYVTGMYTGNPDIYNSKGTSVAKISNVTVQSGYIVKYDKQGNFVWRTTLGGATSITQHVTEDGNLIVSGQYTANGLELYNISDDVLLTLLGTGPINSYIVIYDIDGNIIFNDTFTGYNVKNILVDSDSNYYVAGSDALQNAVIKKYGSDNLVQWTKVFTGTSSIVNGTVLSDNSLLLTGWYTTQLQVDAVILPNSGQTDAFAIKMSSLGVAEWGIYIENTLEIMNVIPVGLGFVWNCLFSAPCVIQATNGTTNVNPIGPTDMLIASFDSTGSYIWHTTITAVGQTMDMSINSSNQITITGQSTADISQIYSANGITGIVVKNIAYITQYDANGQYLWHTEMNGTTIEPTSISNLLTAGTYSDSAIKLLNSDGQSNYCIPVTPSLSDTYISKYFTFGQSLFLTAGEQCIQKTIRLTEFTGINTALFSDCLQTGCGSAVKSILFNDQFSSITLEWTGCAWVIRHHQQVEILLF